MRSTTALIWDVRRSASAPDQASRPDAGHPGVPALIRRDAATYHLDPDVPAMTIEQMRAAYQAQPFRPFVIHLADGRGLRVDHRDFIMTVPGGRTVVIAQPDDTVNIVDLLLVTDLEIKAAAKNGPAGRRKTSPGG